MWKLPAIIGCTLVIRPEICPPSSLIKVIHSKYSILEGPESHGTEEFKKYETGPLGRTQGFQFWAIWMQSGLKVALFEPFCWGRVFQNGYFSGQGHFLHFRGGLLLVKISQKFIGQPPENWKENERGHVEHHFSVQPEHLWELWVFLKYLWSMGIYHCCLWEFICSGAPYRSREWWRPFCFDGDLKRCFLLLFRHIEIKLKQNITEHKIICPLYFWIPGFYWQEQKKQA